MNTEDVVNALLDGRDKHSSISVVVNMENKLPYRILIRDISGVEQVFEITEADMIEVNDALIGKE